jgi:hypothetical protein
MDLAQKANRVKRDLHIALSKPDSNSVRHAMVAFDAFVDGVVVELAALKKAADRSRDEPAETFEPQPEYATESDLRALN